MKAAYLRGTDVLDCTGYFMIGLHHLAGPDYIPPQIGVSMGCLFSRGPAEDPADAESKIQILSLHVLNNPVGVNLLHFYKDGQYIITATSELERPPMNLFILLTYGEETREIEKRIAQENSAEKNVLKLLLLGAGDSGKSTIFKQIKVLFQTGFDDGEKKNYMNVIHANVYQSIKILLDGALQFAEDEPEKYNLLPENKTLAEEVIKYSSESEQPSLTPERAQQVELLWKDPAIQAAYLRGNELQLPDCTGYFMKELDRLAGPDYMPTQEDVLHARVRTTGIVETEFSPEGEQTKKGEFYRLFDVGGQRNERRKWMHLFEGVTAVIFCASLSDYDQLLFEDETKNRMIDTKELFEWILKLPYFKNTSFLLFLNKFDIFEKKINQVPLNTCEWFRDYVPLTSGAAEVENAYSYVKKKFEDLYAANTPPHTKEYRVFKIYKTTALDEQLVKKTFRLVDEALTRKRLKDNNLL